MSKVTIDYRKVESTTKSIRRAAEVNLDDYAREQYKSMRNILERCEGEGKENLIKELEEEQKSVIAAARFVIRLQDMIQNTAVSFRQLDRKYQTGAENNR